MIKEIKEELKTTSKTTGTVPELGLPKEEQLHLDARDQRVKTVKSNIEATRLARVELEKTGVTETEGAKIDRLAKEEKDSAEASKLKCVEDFSVENLGNPDVNALVVKLKEVIEHLNKKCQ